MTRFLSLALLCLSGPLVRAEDWPQFRGPGGLGHGRGSFPTEWSDDKNLLWKVKLPGRGASSPIVVGDHIFLTCWSGPVTKKATTGLTRHLLCLDRAGKLLWKKDFPAPTKDFPHKGYTALHGYASATPVSDGKRLFVFFGAAGVYAFDMAGNQLWHASVGTKTNEWGSGASPILFQNLVIVSAAVESDEVVALDQATGKKVWSQQVKGDESWGTPLLVPVGDKAEIVIGVEKRVLGLDALTGELLWTCRGIDDYICPSAVAHDGIVYAIGGLTTGAIAVKAGGRGDVTNSHRLWVSNKGSNVSSPVLHDGHLYWAHEARGVVYCVDAKSGKLVYQQRLSPQSDRIYASATVADGKIYYVSRTSGVYVVQAGPQHKLLSVNRFASDSSVFNASPAFADGRIYLRSDQSLYCVGSPAVPPQQVRKAAERGLAFLEKDAVKWRKEHQCATCHHGTMTVWTLAEAKSRGYDVAADSLADTVTWTKERLKNIDKPRDTRPGWKMVNTPAMYLALMPLAVPKQEAISPEELKQIAGHLLRHQEEDGSWSWASAPAKNRPPPFFESDQVATLLAYLALGRQAPADPKVKSEVREAREKAAAWLAKNEPSDTTQAAALRLLVTAEAGGAATTVQKEIDRFLSRQNKDGGWGQLKDTPSDAYATGQALYVLSLAGVSHDREEVRRAATFLVSTQKEDGSWPMTRRSHPGVTPSNNVVPITYFGSAWATLGLMRSAP